MLASTVEYLLTKHDCVIVPGLGAFLVQKYSAEIGLSGEIVPPGMKVVFNPELQHNDGLIASYWGQRLSVSGAEAQYRLKKAVNELYHKVEEKKSVRFGILGSLSITSEKVFLFDNSEQSYLTPSYVGLQSVNLPLLQREKESISITRSKIEDKKLKHNEEFVRVQINFRPKQLIRRAASFAAAVALIFGFSSPFGSDNYSSTQKAALGLPDLFQQNNHTQVCNTTNSATAGILQSDTVAPPTNSFTVEPSKRFYIIVSSCPNLSAAEKELKIWETRYPQAGIVEKNGRGRVYAYVYTNRSEAEKRLDEVRKAEKSDAWLYINKK